MYLFYLSIPLFSLLNQREVSKGPPALAAAQREMSNNFLHGLFESALVNPSVGKQGAYDAAAVAGASTADPIGPLSMRIKLDESQPEASAVTTPRRNKRSSQQAALMEFLCKRQDLEERKMEFLLRRAKDGGCFWFVCLFVCLFVYLFFLFFLIFLIFLIINLVCVFMFIDESYYYLFILLYFIFNFSTV